MDHVDVAPLSQSFGAMEPARNNHVSMLRDRPSICLVGDRAHRPSQNSILGPAV